MTRARRTAGSVAVTWVLTTTCTVTAPAHAATSGRPTVTRLSLGSGLTHADATLRVHGTNFTSDSVVRLGGTKATDVVYESPTVLQVRTPNHEAGAVHVLVTTPAGTSAASAASRYTYVRPAHPRPPRFHALPKPPRTRSGTITPSCPSATFCVAADDFGNVRYFDGTQWSSPHHVDSQRLFLSCATDTFCMGIDVDGRATRFDGTGWTAPTSTGASHIVGLSCASARLCLALAGTGGYVAYNGRTWSTKRPVPGLRTGVDARAVSCGHGRCVVATDSAGTTPAELTSFDGSAWSGPTQYLGPDQSGTAPSILDLSCPSTRFCTVQDSDENVAFVRGSTVTVSQAGEDDPDSQPLGVSCVSSTFCVSVDLDAAIDDNYVVTVYDGTKWRTPEGWGYDDGDEYLNVSCGAVQKCFLGSVSAVYRYAHRLGPLRVLSAITVTGASCPTATMCLTTDGEGDAAVERSGSRGPSRAESHHGKVVPSSVSCASASFCAFANGARVRFYRDGSWASIDPLIDTAPLTSVSCGSPRLCVAIDSSAHAMRWNGTRWSAPHSIAGPDRSTFSVSCAGAAVCAVDDSRGGVMIYRGGRWHSRHREFDNPQGGSDANLAGEVACGGRDLCVDVDNESGAVGVYDGHHWRAAEALGSPVSAVTCTSGSFCLVSGRTGGANAYAGQRWSRHEATGGPVLGCVSARDCVLGAAPIAPTQVVG